MASKSKRTIRATLEYPDHIFKPLEVADFCQMKGFAEEWDQLGLSAHGDLRELEIAIMARPKGNPVVSGTGGLRKIRFSPKGWPIGKSGALRVGYVYIEECRVVVLIVVYRKGEMDNISPKGGNIIRQLVSRIKAEFDRGAVR